MRFNPFENRLCRDIRNALGSEFIKAIKTNDIRPFQTSANTYLAQKNGKPVNDYIDHRKRCLIKFFDPEQFSQVQTNDFHVVSVILWNLELFFEFHEWIEIKWLHAHGDIKKALQALILSAIVYEHLRYDRNDSAKKLALKALKLFRLYENHIPEPFDIELFISSLLNLDTDAPKFILPHIIKQK